MHKRILAGFLFILIGFNTLFFSVQASDIWDSIFDKEKKEKGTEDSVLSMSDEKLSSISMLNYMTVLTKEINASSNSKMYLDNTYSSIVNNVNPNAVDEDSLSQIKALLGTIDAYQSIASKREHLMYMYEQNQAKALQNALPNPVSVLNVVQSGNPAKAMVSVIYMAVDAKSSYDSYISDVENKYLQDGWELDESARQNLNESRAEAFTYMVEMCQKNELDGKYALNEKSVDNFVSWENNSNVTRRIDFFEKNKDTYKAYGKYWLVLAKSYYEHGDYSKCLDAVKTYKKMNIDTFRKDHDYAKTLSLALASAKEEYSDFKYVIVAHEFAEDILDNIEPEDWPLRYLVAQTYMTTYSITKNPSDLRKAYDLAEENVNYLIDEQYAKNEEYLADLKEQKAKKTDIKQKKEEIKKYNKWVKEKRKTELPPVYQPLVANCDLLFALANELKLDNKEKKKINEILHSGKKPLFLVEPLEKTYWFDKQESVKKPKMAFDGKTVTIPAKYISTGTMIKVTVTDGKKKKVYKKWSIVEVNRGKKKTDIKKFKAKFKNDAIKKQKYSSKTKVKISVIPSENNVKTLECSFKVKKGKYLFIFDDTQFEMVK